jgi:transcriptional regulator with XRE-family HTH domain
MKLTIRQALKETQDSHQIKGKDLAEMAEIGVQHLASIRNGKSWPSEEVLMKILEAMDRLSPGAKRDFGLRLAGMNQGLATLIEQMPPEELSDTLQVITEAIAESLKKPKANGVSQDKEAMKVA